jgi:chemotaxis protein methyltransferase CheR
MREIIYRHSGISLGPQKEALVAARVGKRMRALHLADAEEYLDYLKKDQSGEELVSLLNAISTNVTSFFREMQHFVFLKETVIKWVQEGQRRFRFWSAACSTGEEPYSMAITIQEALAGREADVKILATDISTHVLEHCMRGEYTEQKVKAVPASLRGSVFERRRQNGTTLYTVRENLRKRVVFKRLNLTQQPFPMRGPLDIVFCRNVMIYFDNDTRRKLLGGIYNLLKHKGYLIVGHAESLTGMMSDFKAVAPAIYLKK